MLRFGTELATLLRDEIEHSLKQTRTRSSAGVCAVMLAFSHNASAARHPMPPEVVSVPDGGTTVMLLGAALGALGLARRFLSR